MWFPARVRVWVCGREETFVEVTFIVVDRQQTVTNYISTVAASVFWISSIP